MSDNGPRREVTALAISELQKIRQRPGMWASTREGFVNLVCGILKLEARCAARVFLVRDFNLFLRPEGSVLRGLHDPVDEAWAHEVVDAAVAHLNKEPML